MTDTSETFKVRDLKKAYAEAMRVGVDFRPIGRDRVEVTGPPAAVTEFSDWTWKR